MDEAILQLYCGTTDRLKLLLRGGAVRRYHAEGRAFDQNVAEHTWRVMVIYLHLWPEMKSAEMLKAILYHDAAEGLVGDVHAPLKRNTLVKTEMMALERDYEIKLGIIGESELDKVAHARLKCADYLELCILAKSTAGSRGADIFRVGSGLVEEHAYKLPEDECRRVMRLVGDINQGKYL